MLRIVSQVFHTGGEVDWKRGGEGGEEEVE